MICWDVQYPDPARALALAGAEAIFMPIWGGNETLAAARAIENHVFLASSGYDHPTRMLDPMGEVLAVASQQEERRGNGDRRLRQALRVALAGLDARPVVPRDPPRRAG
jgi:predicted amidohydrolase